ncbi:DMT family transporter [Thauera sp.]|jgi:drug/metabolite transporter (DMT)-like permease|uniref:DMT family transporter n=1 Tax=Thauera sp. TaxID=1905334 RepID=UPI0026061335|nr:DMT family transporter [Thauera sp.]MCK6410000.1 DMT family transporter [Thauera sp.]
MKRAHANGLLLVAALIWGTAFVAQQTGMRDVGPFVFTGSRFLFGAVIVAPLAFWELRRLGRRGVFMDLRDLLASAVLGGVLFLGAALQQIGIMSTTVSNAGFLTALYVPLVPIAGALLLRERSHWSVWPTSLGCLAGTYLLGGGSLSALSVGDLWVIASALFWAAHVMLVGRVAARKGASVTVAMLQFVVVGVLGVAVGLAVEDVSVGALERALPSIAYAGILSVGVGFTLQVVAQRHTPAADAAILLSCETLFAALAGHLALGETMTPAQMSGGGLIFACVLAVQILPLWRAQRRLAASAG